MRKGDTHNQAEDYQLLFCMCEYITNEMDSNIGNSWI